jgi:hypothetical protein
MSRLSTKQRRAARRRQRRWFTLESPVVFPTWKTDRDLNAIFGIDLARPGDCTVIALGQRGGKSHVMAEIRRVVEEREMGTIKNLGPDGSFAIVATDEAAAACDAMFRIFGMSLTAVQAAPLTATEIAIRDRHRKG